MPTWSRSEATRRCTGVRRKNPLLSAKTKSRSQGLLFALAKINKGIRTRREQTCLRKKTVRWTVFADVVKERSDAKVHGSAPKKSLALRHKAHRNVDRIIVDFFHARKPLERQAHIRILSKSDRLRSVQRHRVLKLCGVVLFIANRKMIRKILIFD